MIYWNVRAPVLFFLEFAASALVCAVYELGHLFLLILMKNDHTTKACGDAFR